MTTPATITPFFKQKRQKNISHTSTSTNRNTPQRNSNIQTTMWMINQLTQRPQSTKTINSTTLTIYTTTRNIVHHLKTTTPFKTQITIKTTFWTTNLTTINITIRPFRQFTIFSLKNFNITNQYQHL